MFLALASLVSSTVEDKSHGERYIYIPENGFISINLPLVPTRQGSLSTRTTHPYFLSELNSVFSRIHMNQKICNPFLYWTKGEMLKHFSNHAILRSYAHITVSCGKRGRRMKWVNGKPTGWHPESTHCGKCVPCIIRRASFHAAGLADNTVYEWPNLKAFKSDEDVWAFRVAITRGISAINRLSLAASNPFPDTVSRDECLFVYRRGLMEVHDFLKNEGAL
jgi:hypothetical protein